MYLLHSFAIYPHPVLPVSPHIQIFRRSIINLINATLLMQYDVAKNVSCYHLPEHKENHVLNKRSRKASHFRIVRELLLSPIRTSLWGLTHEGFLVGRLFANDHFLIDDVND